MRLSEEERNLLKQTVRKIDKEADLFLFGSRTDDDARGGDIDLLVVSKRFDRKDVRRLRVAFYEKFGEQKIDVVVDDGNPSPFIELIRSKVVPL
jgi:predicted nucleotidyltransferase